MAAVQPVSNVSACRARRVSKGPRLALLHFDVDETSLIVYTSDLMKLPANQGKELVLNGTICCNVDGEMHVANVIFLTDDREEAHAFDKKFWDKKNAQVCTLITLTVIQLCVHIRIYLYMS